MKEWIENEATDDELLDLVSEIHRYNGKLEEYVFYAMEELDELFYEMKPTELLSKLADDFNVNEDGFFIKIYGLESCSKWDAVKDIRNNAEEIAEAVEEIKDKIDLPKSLILDKRGTIWYIRYKGGNKQ